VTWQDTREVVYEIVELFVGDNAPYELHELEDHLLDYAGGLSLDTLTAHQARLLMLDEAEQFDMERWLALMEREQTDVC
jgi:hypothetical protein